MKKSIKVNVEALLDEMEPLLGLALTNEATAVCYADVTQQQYLILDPAYVRNVITATGSLVLEFNRGIAELEAYRSDFINKDGDRFASEILLISIFITRLILTRDRLTHSTVTLHNVLEAMEAHESKTEPEVECHAED